MKLYDVFMSKKTFTNSATIVMLSESEITEDSFQYLDVISLSENKSIIEVLKVGTIHDRNLKITEEMLDDFVSNFNAGVYGTDIQVNLGHQREGEAAGWVKKLIKEGERLLAEVEWTPLGVEKIQNKQYKFTSSELALEYKEPKAGKVVKNVFIGVALTNVPAVKGMSPVTLSEQANLFLNSYNNMSKLKEKHAALMAKGKISAEEFGEFKKAADEDGSEEAKGMCSELSKKVEKTPEKAAEKKVEKNSEATETVKLSEFNKLQEDLKSEKEARIKLQETIERKDLSEKITKEVVLSADRGVGFLSEAANEIENFLMELSQGQRDKFFELMAKVRTVDLSVKGGMGVPAAEKKIKTDDEIVARANELLNEKKAANVVEAQKMAMAEAESA